MRNQPRDGDGIFASIIQMWENLISAKKIDIW